MNASRKVIVAGGRDFGVFRTPTFEEHQRIMFTALDRLFRDYDDEYCMPMQGLQIVSGGAKGADTLAIDWAVINWVPFREFLPDWDKHGKKAGILRNVEMAEYADTLVAFWDGESRGTKHMIGEALRKGLEVHVYRYEKLA